MVIPKLYADGNDYIGGNQVVTFTTPGHRIHYAINIFAFIFGLTFNC